MTDRKFDLGQIVMTKGIDSRINEERGFREFVQVSLWRFVHGDWGNLDDEDKRFNDEALRAGEGRLMGSYRRTKTNAEIWIITEDDRSVTTILFPSEY